MSKYAITCDVGDDDPVEFRRGCVVVNDLTDEVQLNGAKFEDWDSAVAVCDLLEERDRWRDEALRPAVGLVKYAPADHIERDAAELITIRRDVDNLTQEVEKLTRLIDARGDDTTSRHPRPDLEH